jgi:AraC-like DNA-binding protein
VRAFVARYPAGHRLPWHDHPAGQLVYAAFGFFTVHVPGTSWVVPADRGVWVPPHVPHTLETRVRSELRAVYFAPDFADLPAHPHVVRASGLMRELVAHIANTAPIRDDDDAGLRAARVLVDQLRRLDVAPLELRDPLEERARDATAMLRDDPALDLDTVAHKVGASRRTIERHVRDATGMSLGEWRHRARMLRGLELLASRTPVSAVAVTVGYSTPSAFVAAFRNHFGTTPARFFAR